MLVYILYILSDCTYLQSILISCKSIPKLYIYIYIYINGLLWLALHKNVYILYCPNKNFYYQYDTWTNLLRKGYEVNCDAMGEYFGCMLLHLIAQVEFIILT